MTGLDTGDVLRLVRTALAEDGDTDVTSEPIFGDTAAAGAIVVARAAGVVAGLPIASVVFEQTGSPSVTEHVADGERVTGGQVLMTVHGPARQLLRAERTALNFLTHLSGIATLTRRWVDAVEGTGAAVRDSRKTLPGLRAPQKYAVRCGGGVNHRMSLADEALIKDNHIVAAGSVSAAFGAVRTRYPLLPVEVECDTLPQVREAIEAGARSILLDNMSLAEMAEAVRMGGSVTSEVTFEASGALTLERARDVAVTGVDYLAVGALTHSAPALDIGLDFLDQNAAHDRRR